MTDPDPQHWLNQYWYLSIYEPFSLPRPSFLGSKRPGPCDQQADTRPPVTGLQQVKKRPQEGQKQKEGQHVLLTVL
jgi:hypothetical protein